MAKAILESAQDRLERTWGHISDDRYERGWANMPEERKNRLFQPHEDTRDDKFALNFEETF